MRAIPSSSEMRGFQPSAASLALLISLRGVPSGLLASKTISPCEADDPDDHTGQIRDRDVAARANVDVLVLRIDLHDVHEGVGAIVGVQELAQRGSCPPNGQCRRASDLGFMGLADQRRQDMAGCPDRSCRPDRRGSSAWRR